MVGMPTGEEINKQMSDVINLAIEMAPLVAKLSKVVFDEHIKVGFKEEQALAIVCSLSTKIN